MRDQLRYSILRADYGCPAFKESFLAPLSDNRQGSRFWHSTFKEPFLPLKRSIPRKAFLALNYQADYGCPLRSLFWRA
jgi:hypothetical protein